MPSAAEESRIRAQPPSSLLPDIPPFLQLPFPSLSSRREPAPVKTGTGTPLHYPHIIPSAAHRSPGISQPFPSLSSRRDPAPVKTGGGNPSLSPLFPRRACPRENGDGNPSPLPTYHSKRSASEPRNLAALPLIVLAYAGTHPSLHCSREEPAPVKTGTGTHPHYPHIIPSAAHRSPGISHPGTAPSSLLPDIPPLLQLPFPSLSPRRDPAPVKTAAGIHPRPLSPPPTYHAERSRGISHPGTAPLLPLT